MAEKFLCIIATFDEETNRQMKEIEHVINEAGIFGTQTSNIPHHITLAYYDTSIEDEVNQLLQDVCAKIKSFDLEFNHIGLFGLKVLFLAPDVNYELLELHKSLNRDSGKDHQGLTAHATLLIDETRNIQKALELVAENFQHLSSRVVSVCLYEFFPSRFIAEYKLQ